MSDDWDPDPKAPPADPGWDGEKAAAGDAEWGTTQKAARRVIAPSSWSSAAVSSLSVARCRLGMTSACIGAWGLMSLSTNSWSSSYTNVAGISFAAILQNRQSAMVSGLA